MRVCQVIGTGFGGGQPEGGYFSGIKRCLENYCGRVDSAQQGNELNSEGDGT